MTFEEAYGNLKDGAVLIGRFNPGEYVTLKDGVMTLRSPDGDLVGWTPSNSDRLSEDWVVTSQQMVVQN